MPNPNPAQKVMRDFDCEDCGCDPCQCDSFEDDPLEDAMMDCGMGRDGLCSKAGSEECDFECPFSR